MKTRINKKNHTLTITVNHDELTSIWLGLDDLADDTYKKGLTYLSKSARIMSSKLLKESVRLGRLESQ